MQKKLFLYGFLVFSCYAVPLKNQKNPDQCRELVEIELGFLDQIMQQQGQQTVVHPDFMESRLYAEQDDSTDVVNKKIYSLEQKRVFQNSNLEEEQRVRLPECTTAGRAQVITVGAACCLLWPIACCVLGLVKLCGI